MFLALHKICHPALDAGPLPKRFLGEFGAMISYGDGEVPAFAGMTML